jgi:hypothetical protein
MGGGEGKQEAGTDRRSGKIMRRSFVPRRGRYLSTSPSAWALLALAFAWAAPWTPPARAASSPGLVVIPVPASGPALSYFKLSARHGHAVQAGTIGLRNPSARALRVVLAPVEGQTIDTLGSTYAPTGSRAYGPARWLRVGRRAVTLAPGQTIVVPISVAVPSTAQPGDYLAGVSVEALDQQAQSVKRHGVSIASVERYAIGVETSIPGARHPAIRFTGADLQRQPGGLAFLLDARNSGNVILQGVHGAVRVTRAGRTVLARSLGPGTFVTASRIAYPVPAFGETPAQGTRYRITAELRYPGGVARLDTTVVFGHRQAVVQQQYGGPRAPGGGTTAWWKIALLVAVILYGLATTTMLLRRRTRPTGG